ncbi:F-box only protein 6, partial [Orchesella cincta]
MEYLDTSLAEELPDTVLEVILSKVPEDDILKCSLVCRTWREIITRKSFWKIRFKNRRIPWEEVPKHVRDKPKGWMILYAHLRYRILSKNYIQNPSGHNQFEGWTILPNDGLEWRVEQVPQNCSPLPAPVSNIFERNDESCFVPAFEWCSKYYWIDIRKEGLTPSLLKLLLPIQINCSQMYTARYDCCGGVFSWELRLLNSQEKILSNYESPTVELSSTTEWHTAQYSFQFGSEDEELVQDLRYIVFSHEGRDTQWWAGRGQFAMKFARSCVTFEALETEPERNGVVEHLAEFGKDGGRNSLQERNRNYENLMCFHPNYDDDDDERK